MGNRIDLVTLDDLKAWIYKTPTGAGAGANDDLLKKMITRASQLVCNYLNRTTFYKQSVTELRDGYGKDFMLLREFPVLSISSVTVCTTTVLQSTGPSDTGYSLEPWDGIPPGSQQTLILRGYAFAPGRQQNKIIYEAGYVVQGETATIPDDGAYTVTTQPNWLADEGVTFADGTALTLVASGPASGQYALGNAPGQYVFAVADAGKAILLSYDFCPVDLAQAVIEWIADRYAYMTRTGEVSRSVGGQTTATYAIKDIPTFVQLVCEQFQRRAPI